MEFENTFITPVSTDNGDIKGVSDGYIRNASLAYIGSQIDTEKGNDTYIYNIRLNWDRASPRHNTGILPKDENIAVFAAITYPTTILD